MKEHVLRKWHRRLGISLALLIILQAGSGLLITFMEWSERPPQAATEQAGRHGSAEGVASKQGSPSSVDHEDADAQWEEVLEFIHHKGGLVGGVYRLIVGLGVVLMVLSGSGIFFKIQARVRART